MSVFVHAQGKKTVHVGGGGVKQWQNSVHIVVECPLLQTSRKACTPMVVHKEARWSFRMK